jgi:short-subunit dehydrogenase
VRVAGTVALVTGASSGIGWHTAIDLAEAGATVVAVARREERLGQLMDELRSRGQRGAYAVCDVADRAQVEATSQRVLDEHGRIDVLVNNAGTPLHKSFADCTVEELETVMQVNYLGTVYWMKAVLPQMIARRSGSVVNVASMAGAVPWAWEAGYSASKAAVIAICEAVRPELLRHDINVCWVNPGLVRTEIFTEASLRHLPPSAARTWLEPGVLSAAIVDAIEHDRAGITVPRVMALPAVFRHLAPRLFRAGLRRTYEATLRRDQEAGATRP